MVKKMAGEEFVSCRGPLTGLNKDITSKSRGTQTQLLSSSAYQFRTLRLRGLEWLFTYPAAPITVQTGCRHSISFSSMHVVAYDRLWTRLKTQGGASKVEPGWMALGSLQKGKCISLDHKGVSRVIVLLVAWIICRL